MHKEITLPPKYNPSGLEKKWYSVWENKNLFSHKLSFPHSTKTTFSMVIPPPNITGSLHLGHALNHIIQDILARYHRMKGDSVLWLPGTDHAGIATQNVVEKLLEKEGKNRYELGREAFENQIWQWKKKSGGMITKQQRQLGESVDWNYESFTLEPHFNKVVNQVFIQLYKEKLIYRAKRMINWCPVNQTALANIEVEYRTVNGNLYYIKYFFLNSNKYLLVATTRPETLLGDEALAVHPDDSRYKKFIGKKVILPLLKKEIPIIADTYVNQSFGSGVVKITPGHDFNDFEVGQRHHLPTTIVIDARGKINSAGGTYVGLSREAARKKIIADLKDCGLLEKFEKYQHKIGHSYRSGAIIEPLPSTQWFVNAKELAKEAIQVVEDKKIIFTPKRWKKVYFEWMYNIQDWCISRQLWWGHRIPVWYDEAGGVYVGLDEEHIRKEYSISPETLLHQDKDVLDTWFSSALWPFITLWNKDEIFNSSDWPKLSSLQQQFYPNNILVTGFDIIFFWVARMIMMGTHFMKEIPFREVYIHGLVRDAERKKMSKSKGNVVDPLEKMQEYGTDAFRFFMISILPEDKDIVYDESRLKGYQAFCNKIWNTARYLWMNQSLDDSISEKSSTDINFSEIDYWMIQHFNQMLIKVESAIKNYRFAEYSKEIYNFTWKIFCDYYIELSKISLNDPTLRKATLYTLNLVFKNILKILHPIMPFITEELYSYWKDKNKKENNQEFIIVSKWPVNIQLNEPLDAFTAIENIIDIIYTIRNLRGELSIPPSEKIKSSFILNLKTMMPSMIKYTEHILSLAKLSHFNFINETNNPQGVKIILSCGTLFLDILDKVDISKEKERLAKESNKIKKELTSLELRMQNQDFLKKAPQKIIEKEKERINFLQKKMIGIDELLNNLF